MRFTGPCFHWLLTGSCPCSSSSHADCSWGGRMVIHCFHRSLLCCSKISKLWFYILLYTECTLYCNKIWWNSVKPGGIWHIPMGPWLSSPSCILLMPWWKDSRFTIYWKNIRMSIITQFYLHVFVYVKNKILNKTSMICKAYYNAPITHIIHLC